MLAPKHHTYYLAGQMSGLPLSNFPLFDRVARLLRKDGYTIVSPSELDDETVREGTLAGKTYEGRWGEFLSRDVKIVADDVQGLILLPGWENSRGARLEVFVGLLTKKEFAIWDHNTDVAIYVTRDHVRHQLKENMP